MLLLNSLTRGAAALIETQITDFSGYTKIGDMTGNGGLAAAFNQTTVQAGGSCAAASGACSVGIDFGSAVTISRFKVWGSSNGGINNDNNICDLDFKWSDDNSSYTSIHTHQITNALTNSVTYDTGAFGVTSVAEAHRYWKLFLSRGANTDAFRVAELEMWSAA